MQRMEELKLQIQEFLGRYVSDVRSCGEEMEGQSMPVLTEELFSLFEKNGNRLQYEDAYFTRRKFLTVYGLLAVIEQDRGEIRPATVRKLEETLREICREECWALPAHVTRKDNPDWRITVDLFASETAETLAEILYRVGEVLSADVKALVRENVERRVFAPYYNSPVPYGNWEHCRHNWNAVCAGSIGCASIYLMQDTPKRLQKCLERICAALPHFLEGYAQDGTCMEGLSYFSYGMTYYMGFAEAAHRYSGGRINLLSEPKCEDMAAFQQKCYFDGGRTISFSDGNSHEKFRMGLTCYLSIYYMKVSIPDISCAAGFEDDTCWRFLPSVWDYLWTKRYLAYLEEEDFSAGSYEDDQTHVVLPHAQWSICKSPSGTGMACKGGSNGEPHNHNDVGSFMYVSGKDVFLDDLGAGEYTKEYFGRGRHRILCNSSLGHSVPIINGRGQRTGKRYAGRNFQADGRGNTSFTLEGAYEKGTIGLIRREFCFAAQNGGLTVTDSFEPSAGTRSITENLITRFCPDICGNVVTLIGEGGGRCRIEIEGAAGEITCTVCAHSSHTGEPEQVFSIRWDVPVKEGAVSKVTVMAQGSGKGRI